ncbi:MAG: ABC transporter permease, partial [Acutalibacteraceae bacterium]|nr:ABC transporter permease [Acutalibacteraceae bacterium]
SYSILDFPDLSVDGTFPLGGVICTILMLKLGIPALPAILLSFFAGLAAGAITGILHVKFNITKLLSGIIVMTALLSVTLALTKLLTRTGFTTTIFSFRSENLSGIFGGKLVELLGSKNRDYMILIIELVFVIAIKLIIDLFLKTKLGYMLRATGDNEMLVVSLGKDSGTYKILGLALANGFVAMSGALYSNLFSQYDNSCGSGKVVMALASVIIGMAVFSKIRFVADTTAVIFGAVIYSLCLNYLVLVDTNGIYLKLLNAVMFALILIFNDKTSSLVSKHSKLKGGLPNVRA